MGRQSIIVLIVAVFLGLIAVYLVNAYLTSAEGDAVAQGETRQIAVARIPLEFGAELNSQNVRMVDWPAGSIPPGSFSDLNDFNENGQPLVVLRPIAPGEPVLRSRLSGEGGRATLSALLPENMRAISIPITAVTGVAGFALPGDRVDVLLTQTDDSGDRETDILLQNVRVIAIDQSANDNAEEPTVGDTATLEVTREDAQVLALAREVGTLSLALRSVRTDEEFILSATLGEDELTTGPNRRPLAYGRSASAAATQPTPRLRRTRRPAPPSPPRPSTYDVEIIRGTAGTNYDVGQYRGN